MTGSAYRDIRTFSVVDEDPQAVPVESLLRQLVIHPQSPFFLRESRVSLVPTSRHYEAVVTYYVVLTQIRVSVFDAQWITCVVPAA